VTHEGQKQDRAMIRTILLIAAIAALSACATAPPPYTAAASSAAVGYSETQIESNRYFVTYRAPSGADVAVLEDYALLRAAELTLENGREWFWVDRQTVDEQYHGGYGPSVGVGVGGVFVVVISRRAIGGSVGVGINFPLGGGGGGQRARSATLEVRFGEGPKPDEPNAYNAREVSTNLRARAAPTG
jgi:hypothetical protein